MAVGTRWVRVRGQFSQNVAPNAIFTCEDVGNFYIHLRSGLSDFDLASWSGYFVLNWVGLVPVGRGLHPCNADDADDAEFGSCGVVEQYTAQRIARAARQLVAHVPKATGVGSRQRSIYRAFVGLGFIRQWFSFGYPNKL
jgi:hypothetical protein